VITLEREGMHRVLIAPTDALAKDFELEARIDVAAGTNPLSVDLQRAALRVRWSSAPAEHVVEYTWKGPGGLQRAAHGRVDADGQWRIPFLPAGSVEVQGFDASVHPWRPLARGAVVLRAGAEPEVELR
jgi:hypothetical protein